MSDLVRDGDPTTTRRDGELPAEGIERELRAASDAIESRREGQHERALAAVKEGLGLSMAVNSEADTLRRQGEENPLPVHEAVILAAAKRLLNLSDEPTRFAHYAIESRIDGGGMGVVHVARDELLDRRVALKLLRPLHGAGGEALLARAQAEAQAMAQLNHPRVATVFEVGLAAAQAFIAMELIEGETLGAWRRRVKPGQRQILAMYVEIGRALAAVHRAEVVHGDFKPDNVVVQPLTDEDRVAGLASTLPLGKPKLIDFGMATRLGGGVQGGTPEYMALEQLGASPQASAASDQYSFCVALFEDLLGSHPYVGQTFEEFAETTRLTDPGATPEKLRRSYITQIGENLRSGVVLWPEELRRIPGWLRRALARGLSPRREDRFPSLEALLSILDRPRVAAIRRRWAGVLGIGGALGVAAALGLTAMTATAPCEDLPDQAAEVWTERMEEALGPEATALLGPWATRWRSVRKEVCEATWVRAETSDALHDARVRCLDDRARQAIILRETIERGAITPARASEDLRPAEICLTIDRPGDLVPLGQDEIVKTIAADLVRTVFADEVAGDYPRGHQEAARLVTAAIATGYRPLIAAALYRRARVALQDHVNAHLDDETLRTRGEHDLAEALRLASRAGDDALYVDASIFGARYRAVVDALPGSEELALVNLDLDPKRLAPAIRADLTDAEALLRYHVALAAPAVERGVHLEIARDQLRDALAAYTAEDRWIEVAKAQENLGDVLLALGDPNAATEAFDEATRLWTGPLHVDADAIVGALHARRIGAAAERDDGTAPGLCANALAWLEASSVAEDAPVQAAQIDLSCAAALWSTPMLALPHARHAAAAALPPSVRAPALQIAAGLILHLDAPSPAELEEAARYLDQLGEGDVLVEAYRGRLHLRRRKIAEAASRLEAVRALPPDDLPPDEAAAFFLDLAEVRRTTRPDQVDDALENAARQIQTLEEADPTDPAAQAHRRRFAALSQPHAKEP